MTAIAVIIWLAALGTSGAITNHKGRGWGIGLLLGGFLSLIGLGITLFLSDKNATAEQQAAFDAARQVARTYRQCPHCREQVRRDASVCPHCRLDVPAWTFHEDHWWHLSKDGAWYYLDETTNEWRLSPSEEPSPSAAANGDELVVA
jgi:hypothetical protein